MAARHRLSSLVCQDIADAKLDIDALLTEVHNAAVDGEISEAEMRRIIAAERALVRSMHAALVRAEDHDLVLARFEYALKAGPDAPPHKFLRQKQEDVWRLAEAQRKAPTAAVKRVRRGNERSG